MKNIRERFVKKYFGEQLEYRARAFNLTLFIGVFGTLLITPLLTFLLVREEGQTVRPGLIIPLLNIALIWYANKYQKFELCYWIQTIITRMIIATIGFFNNGGYSGGMFAAFVYHVVFTAIIFKGKTAIIVPIILFAQYFALCIYGYHNPHTINLLGGSEQLLFNISTLFTVCISLSAIMILYIRIHDRQRRELDEARQTAVEYEKQNRELVTEMSHELRTPLATMSGYALYAVEKIQTEGINEKTLADLKIVSDEAGRLATMADETLAILRSPGTHKRGGKQKSLADIGAIVKKVIALQTPVTERIGLDLQTQIDNGLTVTGDAGELSQIIWNILHNAIVHSSADTVTVSAKSNGNNVLITVEDDGDGIDEENLRNAFERGTRINARGKRGGLGLPISRDIARRHGGDISIESLPNKWTRVTVSLPLSSEDKENNNQENNNQENNNRENSCKENDNKENANKENNSEV